MQAEVNRITHSTEGEEAARLGETLVWNSGAEEFVATVAVSSSSNFTSGGR